MKQNTTNKYEVIKRLYGWNCEYSEQSEMEKKCSVKIKDRICSAEVVIRSAFNLTYQCT